MNDVAYNPSPLNHQEKTGSYDRNNNFMFKGNASDDHRLFRR